MDNTTKWLIGGFCYLLGTMGTFFVKFMEVRKTSSSDMQTFEEAAIAGILWPYELLKLVL